MTTTSPHISYAAPVSAAWKRMVTILFSPFDIAKWFVIGFCAWLASLGQNGGGSFNYNWRQPGGPQAGAAEMEKVVSFLKAYMVVIAVVVSVILLVSLGIGLVLSWLRARSTFILLDNVARNRAEIEEPWKRYKRQGNSLFLWRVGFGVVCFVVFLAIAGCGVLFALPSIQAHSFMPSAIVGIVLAVPLFIAFCVVTAYIGRFLEDFVVPIMYKFDVTAVQAWKHFHELLKVHFGTFIVYGLFYFVLSLGAGVVVIVAFIATCCIACCLAMIPYINAVLLLPITVFFRAYSIEFLRQFSEEYNVFYSDVKQLSV